MKYFCLKLKCINTEDCSDYPPNGVSSSSSNKRPCSTLKNTQRSTKEQTSDYKAFKLKYEDSESNLPSLSLIKLSYPHSFVTTADLNRLDFSPLSYPVKDLILYAKAILDAHPERKAVSKSFNLHKLVQLIAGSYNINPYHHFTHAFSVMLLLFQSYNRSQHLQRSLSQRQWFFVFVAALIHDLNHPGHSNNFQVKTKSKMAMEYGNESVLEKMHLSSFWKMLKNNSQVDFLQCYCLAQSNQIKKLISRMVLSTDTSKHSHNLTSLKNLSCLSRRKQREHSMFFVQQLFHACDIGNPCLNFDDYLNWSVLISYQFNEESESEKRLGLEITPHLAFDGMEAFYKGQVGFCGGLVLPIWKELANVFPELSEMVQNVYDNMTELERRLSECGK